MLFIRVDSSIRNQEWCNHLLDQLYENFRKLEPKVKPKDGKVEPKDGKVEPKVIPKDGKVEYEGFTLHCVSILTSDWVKEDKDYQISKCIPIITNTNTDKVIDHAKITLISKQIKRFKKFIKNEQDAQKKEKFDKLENLKKDFEEKVKERKKKSETLKKLNEEFEEKVKESDVDLDAECAALKIRINNLERTDTSLFGKEPVILCCGNRGFTELVKSEYKDVIYEQFG